MMNQKKLQHKVFIATSLDGFIARKNGDISWLKKDTDLDKEDYGYHDFMSGVDGIIMGRNTYEKVLSFKKWPYSCPVIVMSQSLCDDHIPEYLKNHIEIMSGTPKKVSQCLIHRGWSTACVDGGQLIQSFLKKNMIHDMFITKVPVLLGKGISLFGQKNHDIFFKHISTQSYPSGHVQSHYQCLSLRS